MKRRGPLPDKAARSERSVARLLLRAAPVCVLPDATTHKLEIKDALLLAFLAIEGSAARELLAERLWPRADAARSRANLRQRLMRLRRQVGVELVTGVPLAKLADGVVHDLEAGSEILAPIAADEAEGLAGWLHAARLARRSRRIEELAAAAARAEAAGEIAAALDCAQTLLAVDRVSEHAHRRVMRLHYLRGDNAAARAAYARCAEVLERELGARPAQETEALLRQIESGQLAAGASRGPLPITLLRPPTLIGREAPRKRLEEAWRDGRTLLLTGEAGMGKSRLLEEFVAQLPGVVLVSARPGDRALPLALLARLVRQTSNRLPQIAQRPEHAELTRALPGATERLEGARPRRIGALLGALLDDVALTGFVIDDLQWADVASLDALREARGFDHLARVRWGFASRPPEDEEGAQRIAAVQADTAAETIALAPLDADMLRELLASLLIEPGDAGLAVQRLLAKVGGNPLFVLELLRQLHGAGGDWSRIVVPPRLTDLLDRRLHALSENAVMLARVAAIAGTDFSAEIAEAVTGLGTLALADPWHELEDAQLLRATSFTHDLALAAVQRSIPESIAARLHAKVAARLERTAADPARIARHHLAAGQQQQAAPFLHAAARRAWQAGCAREGAEFYFQSADIELAAGRPDAAFDILFEAGYAMTEGGALAQLERACDLLTKLARTPVQRARALLGAVSLCQVRGGGNEELAQAIDAALIQAIAAGDRAVEAECRSFKSHVAARTGRLREAVEQLAAAETLFREIGQAKEAKLAQSSMAITLGLLGECARAVEMLQSLAPSIDRANLAGLRAQQTAFSLLLGRHAEAHAAAIYAAQTLATADVGDRDWPSVAANTAASFRRMAEFTHALSVLDEAKQRAGRQSPFEPVMEGERAQILLDLGRPDLAARSFAAFESCDPAKQLFASRLVVSRAAMLVAAGKPALPALAGTDPLALENVRVACDWMFLRGQFPSSELALRQAEALLARCTSSNLVGLRVPLLALLAKFNAECGRLDEGLRNAEQALASLDGCIPALLPLVHTWLAAAFAAAGSAADAQRSVRAGCAWVENTASASVPAQFRESFKQRNPINRALLLAATRG
ncbi:MAG TPA: AAA family ATPase [Burkholderiaceae bacterium]|nr:AAA family ATPase [Burkholderiaceae bacterium]